MQLDAELQTKEFMPKENSIKTPDIKEINLWKSEKEHAIEQAAEGLFIALIASELKPSPFKTITQIEKEQKIAIKEALTSYANGIEASFLLLHQEATTQEQELLQIIMLRWVEQMRIGALHTNASLLSAEEADTLEAIARRLQEQGSLKEAIAIYRLIAQWKPNHLTSWVALAHGLRDSGEIQQAAALFDLARELFPEAIRISLYAGAFYLEQQEYKKARILLETTKSTLQQLGEEKGSIYTEVIRLLTLCKNRDN